MRIGTTALWLALSALPFAGLTACGDESPSLRRLQEDLDKAWQDAKAWGVEKRKEAEALYDEKEKELEAEWEAAKDRVQRSGKESSAKVEAKWDRVQQRLADMKNASKDAWAEARDAFVKAYEDFRETVREHAD